jgi:hypothetical protein
VREVGRRPLIGDARLLSVEGIEYVGRSTAHKKETPWEPAVRRELFQPVRRGARAGTRCEGGNFKASRGAGWPGEGARGLGRRAARMPRAAGARARGRRVGRRGAGAQYFGVPCLAVFFSKFFN